MFNFTAVQMIYGQKFLRAAVRVAVYFLPVLCIGYFLSAPLAKGMAPTLKIRSVKAETCNNKCKEVYLKFSIKNPYRYALCFPIRYIVNPSRELFLTESNSDDGDYQVVADQMDVVPDVPGRHEEFVKLLRAEPNIYVPPNKTLDFEAISGEKYEIPVAHIKVTVGLYVYPCAEGKFKYLTASADLTFSQ